MGPLEQLQTEWLVRRWLDNMAIDVSANFAD